uniref:Uncharacterized protein n=1 Tax=Setaria italica TaxID=4555 RepID=K3YFB1_SETIT
MDLFLPKIIVIGDCTIPEQMCFYYYCYLGIYSEGIINC